MGQNGQRRYAYKEHVWPMIKSGELMRLTFDLETAGITRSNVPYATRHYPFITEYGDALSDFAGNYHNSVQVFPRRPDWKMYDVSAALLQRLSRSGVDSKLFDSEERQPYWHAMADMIWRLERAAYDYGDLAKKIGDPLESVTLQKHYKAGRNRKAVNESHYVYKVPLLNKDNDIVYDVFYDPDNRKIFYKYDPHDKDDPYYKASMSTYYTMETDEGRIHLQAVEPGLGIRGFNIKPYDIPIFRTVMYTLGYSPPNSTFIYGRGTATNKQKKKNHVLDIRDLAWWASVAGPQSEQGVKQSEFFDKFGNLRVTEKLGEYHYANQDTENAIRMIPSGLFNVHDLSRFYRPKAHVAAYDSYGAMALENRVMDIAPWIYGELAQQSDKKNIYSYFTDAKKTEELPVFSLPRRDGGRSMGETPYIFINTDEEYGKFGNLIFLKADGSLNDIEFEVGGVKKKLHELREDETHDEWTQFLKSHYVKNNPDAVVKIIHFNKWKGALHLKDVLRNTSLSAKYLGEMPPKIIKDTKYALENRESKGMIEGLMTAVEKQQRGRRFDGHFPEVPLMEDELVHRFAGEVYYLDDKNTIERLLKGDYIGPLADIVMRNKAEMNNVLSTANGIDETLKQLSVIPHKIDAFLEEDANQDLIVREGDDANIKTKKRHDRLVMNNYIDLVQRSLEKFKKKKWPGLERILTLKNPKTKRFFFAGGAGNVLDVKTPAEAAFFRDVLAKEILRDYLKEVEARSEYIYGWVKDVGKPSHKLLFHDIDNGTARGKDGKGVPPVIVDKHGRVLSMEYLKRVDFSDALKKLDQKEWTIVPWSLRSAPSILQLMHRLIDQGRAGVIPERLMQIYYMDKDMRLGGIPTENETTARVPNIKTAKFQIKRHFVNTNENKGLSLERGDASQGENLKVEHEESLRALSEIQDNILEIEKKHAQDQKKMLSNRFDPVSGLAYGFIKYPIKRDANKAFEKDPNFVVIDVPAEHLDYVIKQYDVHYSEKMIGIVKPKSQKAANQRGSLINLNKKQVIIRAKETGQLFMAGGGPHKSHASLREFPDRDNKRFTHIIEGVLGDYQRAGYNIDKTDFQLLEIEGLYPIANSRIVHPEYQSIKVSEQMFRALTDPKSGRIAKVPITTVILPAGFSTQTFKPNSPMNIQEMQSSSPHGHLGGSMDPVTGHMYETTTKDIIGLDEFGHPVGMPLDELLKKIRSGDIRESLIQAAGIADADELSQKLRQEWILPEQLYGANNQSVLVIDFEKVNEEYFKSGRKQEFNKYAYFDMQGDPVSAFQYDDKPISPQVYRSFMGEQRLG